jgi:DNA-binding MarR family transcriptional regulator
MKRTPRARRLEVSSEEIGFLCEGMSLASRPMGLAIKNITEEYSLGPRGAWITLMIATGKVCYPSDLAPFFEIGRSLISVELVRLIEAGLISHQKSTSDGRRAELKLTALGDKVQRRVQQGLEKLVLQRLSSYTREQVLVCARMLRDFRVPGPHGIDLRTGKSRPRVKRT